MSVLVVDSGVGGLNVLRRLVDVKKQHYIYVADHAFCPYGVRSPNQVANRVAQIANHFANCKQMVLACNTAACALDCCKCVLPVPCVDVVRATCDYVNGQNFGVVTLLATTLTVNSGLYRRLIDGKTVVCAFAADRLVKFAEGEPCTVDDVERVLSGALPTMRKSDAIILGCTHFDCFAEQIARFLPSGCRVISSSDCLVNKGAECLPDNECGITELYTTDISAVRKTSEFAHRRFEYLAV